MGFTGGWAQLEYAVLDIKSRPSWAEPAWHNFRKNVAKKLPTLPFSGVPVLPQQHLLSCKARQRGRAQPTGTPAEG